ncbi:MAG: protein kinase domain-containing protein [Thermoanaerobaculia bacterium]
MGPYEILSPLGAGGMGEVYRGRDSKLGRDVAIKVLPESVAADGERLARFEREARVLALLNHPNIAAIYGVEDSTSVKALILELVEGPTLQDRIEEGPIPVEEAVPIARQIAEALEAAHEKGIVHRDLKPANVKVNREDQVKVLDFGLAKALDPEVSGVFSSPNLTQSPTLSIGTQAGMILGTAPYMSPEQARGKPADKRADIWAFGVLLYEMLTGKRLFAGETVSDTLAAVLKTEIDFGALPPATPGRMREMLARCLERDPKNRLRDIGEARISLTVTADGALKPIAEAADGPRRAVTLPLFMGAIVGAAAIAALLAWRGARSSTGGGAGRPVVTEFSIGVEDFLALALSPDGQRLAWLTGGDQGRTLWVRNLDDRVPHPIVTDPEVRSVFWSRDDASLAVGIGEKLWRFPATGGEQKLICDFPKIKDVPGAFAIAGAWLDDGSILFAAWRGGIYRVPAQGGEPDLFIPIDPKVDVDFHQILVLPDGKSLLLAVHRQSAGNTSMAKARLELFRNGRRSVVGGLGQDFALGPVGYADGVFTMMPFFSLEHIAWGAAFDPERGVVTSKKFVLISRVRDGAVGADGTLAYVPPEVRTSVVARVDRSGAQVGTLGQPLPQLSSPVRSADGSRLAMVLDDSELSVEDLARGTLTRVAREETPIDDPQWSPDGRTIYYFVPKQFALRRVRADPGSAPETILDETFGGFLAPEGNGIVYARGSFELGPGQGLFWAPLDAAGRTGERKKLLGGIVSGGRLGPGGEMLTYEKQIDGRSEAFLTTFPNVDQTIQLSSGGGSGPQWSRDGKSVFYLSGSALVEVDVGFGPAGRLIASPEKKLFELKSANLRPDGWSVAPDGMGFLFVKLLKADSRSEIVVVRNGVQRAKAAVR